VADRRESGKRQREGVIHFKELNGRLDAGSEADVARGTLEEGMAV